MRPAATIACPKSTVVIPLGELDLPGRMQRDEHQPASAAQPSVGSGERLAIDGQPIGTSARTRPLTSKLPPIASKLPPTRRPADPPAR